MMENILKEIFAFLKRASSDREYLVSFEIANPTQGSTIPSGCNTIGLKNTGTSTVWINNLYPLMPNESFIIDGNAREKDTTVYNYYFDNSVPGLRNSLVIIRKTLK